MHSKSKIIYLISMSLAMLILGASSAICSQSCVSGAGAVYYIVRDDKGKILSPSKLSNNSLKSETIEFIEGNGTPPQKIDALIYGQYHPQACGLNDEKVELKLEYGGKIMTLVFKGVRGQKRVSADSLKFQKGVFEIDARAEKNPDGILLAAGWKKVD